MMDTTQASGGANPTPLAYGYNRVAHSSGSGVTGRPDARHRGSANIVWVDGHATTVKSNDPLDYNSMYDLLGKGGIGATAERLRPTYGTALTKAVPSTESTLISQRFH